MARLAIVIPTLGRSRSLGEVLAAIAAQEPPLDGVEVILALDPSGRRPPGVPFLSGLRVVVAERPGASAARNAGWRTAEAELILFLDDDVVPTTGLLAAHLAAHRAGADDVAVVGPVRWSHRVRVTPFMRWLERGVLFDYGSVRGTDAGWGRLYSANLSLPRALLERTGGFDEEAFPFLYEDLDLGRRLADLGVRVLLAEAAVGEHVKTETPETWAARLDAIAAAERRFVARYPEEPPYYYDRFRTAAGWPAGRGLAWRLARFVPPGLPRLGAAVWRNYDARCWRMLAARYLEAWDTAGTDGS